MSEASQRRNPLRLFVNKETQLRILWLVWGAVFFCMALTATMLQLRLQWIWGVVLALALGTIVSLWVSRQIAGPLYRIQRDLESMLKGVKMDKDQVQLRENDHSQQLASVVNELIEKAQKRTEA